MSDFEGTLALKRYEQSTRPQKRRREAHGDGFGGGESHLGGAAAKSRLYPCFASLFQRDHLGVECALSAHEEVLRLGGLLQPHRRLQGHSIFPRSKHLEGLIIDDFFAIGIETVKTLVLNSFAATALSQAREVYKEHGLLGYLKGR